MHRLRLFCFRKKYSPWIMVTVAIYTVVFSYLFAENFVFSKNIDLLSFREVDDLAFQASLRYFHQSSRLLSLNDYAYGWIFWFPLVIVNYPFYFLSVYGGIDMPLIVIPREISLIYMILTGWILYKTLSVYTKDSFIKAIGLLLFLSYPTTSFFSIKFGTAPQTMFFASLAFYLAIHKSTLQRKDLTWIALSLAAAVSTKLSGLLMAPIIGLILADRYQWKINRKNLFDLGYFIAVLAIGFLVLSQYNWRIVWDQMQKITTRYGAPTPLMQTLNEGIASRTLYGGIVCSLLLGLLIRTTTEWRKKSFCARDLLYVLGTLILVIVYLVLRIKMGIDYIVIYFSVVSMLLILGIVCLDVIKQPFLRYAIGIMLFLVNLWLNWPFLWAKPDAVGMYANAFYVKSQSVEIQRSIALQQELQKMVGNPRDYPEGLYILRDFRAPAVYSGMRPNVYDFNVFDNVHEVMKLVSDNKPFDVILLHKKSTAFLPQREFQELLVKSDPKVAISYRQDKDVIEHLLKDHSLRNTKYQLVMEKGDVLAYKRME